MSTRPKSLIALVPAGMLLLGSIALFLRARTVPAFLQVFGAGCLVMVVVAHLCEALQLFPWMGWGLQDSAGHYLDLASAALGLTLFPVGYLWHALIEGT